MAELTLTDECIQEMPDWQPVVTDTAAEHDESSDKARAHIDVSSAAGVVLLSCGATFRENALSCFAVLSVESLGH